jgi:L-arabinose isomerase
MSAAMERARSRRPKVALVHPYWSFWEASVPYDLRADREQFAAEARSGLAVEWVEPAQAECVLVLQTMATPPATTLAALPPLPLVVWAAHRRRAVPEQFDHSGITTEGATVGTPMLTSVLVREGRPFELVVGLIDDPETNAAVTAALCGAAGASRVRGSRIARVGPVQEGYLCVDTPDELLAARLGVEVVRLPAAEVKAAYDRVTTARMRMIRDETESLYAIEAGGEGLERSLRAACAIEDLVSEHALSAGAINCHVPEIRLGGIGVAPCFGLGRSASAGVPWTCTGDVLTAAAMLISESVGGAAQYHELESYDYESGEFVIASSGEHDLALAPGTRPSLIANDWFKSDPCVGVCARFSPAAGAASLLALADIGHDYRLIVADGDFTGRAFPATGTANAGFRFRHGLAGWRRWCDLGASHHSCASPGELSAITASCARFLGIEHAVV